MNTNGHLCSTRLAGSIAPFATYYVYYSAGAETV